MNAALPQQMDELPKRDVGSVLRSAREAAGLTVADVSRQLNLGKAIIAALETGDMEALPPAAFVRGYLRSYGKLLELDVAMLLDLLDRSGMSDPDIAPVTMLTSQRASSDPLMRWMSVAVFFVLAVMVIIWWQTKNGVDETVTAQSESVRAQQPAQSQEMLALQSEAQVAPAQNETTQAAEQVPAVAEPQVVVDPQPVEPMAVTAGEPLADGTTQQSAATDSARDAAVQPPSQDQAATVDDGVVAVLTESDMETGIGGIDTDIAAQPEVGPETQVVANSDAVATAPEATEAAESVTTGIAEPARLGGDELVLLIDGSSWMEVRDALGQQLYYGLYDSPAPLRLTGQMPFVVFLGNSPAVTILFNGETYDQTSFNRANNTARFALDTAGLRRP